MGVVVPLIKKGDRKVCSNYQGITLLSPPGKVYSRVPERKVRLLVEPQILGSNVVVILSMKQDDNHITVYSCEGTGGSMGVCPTSLHAFCGSAEGL